MRNPRAGVVIGAVTVVITIGIVAGTMSGTGIKARPSIAAPSALSAAATSTDGCLYEVVEPDSTVQCLSQPPVPSASQPSSGVPAGWDGTASVLPACVPVDSGANTVGCVLKTDLYASSDRAQQLAAQYPIGKPVYDLSGTGHVVGYLGKIGFVPIALADQVDALTQCTATLRQGTAPLSDQCKTLLTEQGVPATVLLGH